MPVTGPAQSPRDVSGSMLSITWNATTLCSWICVSVGSSPMIATSTKIVPAAKKFPGIQDVVT